MRFNTLVPILFALSAVMAGPVAAQQPPLGRWKTIDDATGKPKSIIEVYRTRNGEIAGRVSEILDTKDGPDPACTKCKGALQGRPIRGMTILWGLKADASGRWSGGRVMDPENGKDYKAKLELLDGGSKLGVSGCIAFICRQQVWIRQ